MYRTHRRSLTIWIADIQIRLSHRLTPRLSAKRLSGRSILDEEIGVTLRLSSYFPRLPDRRLALKFMLQDAASWRPLLMLAYHAIRPAMMKHMNINADTASQSEQRLRAALDKLDAALDGRPFLVENRFSRADLTAWRALIVLFAGRQRSICKIPGGFALVSRGGQGPPLSLGAKRL